LARLRSAAMTPLAIITVPPPNGVDEYLKHFANDVKIYENEKNVGIGIGAWKTYLDSHRNVSHQVKLVRHGNPIIVAEST
jgi:hypothetical protein